MSNDWSSENQSFSINESFTSTSFNSHQIAQYQINRAELDQIFPTLGENSYKMEEVGVSGAMVYIIINEIGNIVNSVHIHLY